MQRGRARVGRTTALATMVAAGVIAVTPLAALAEVPYGGVVNNIYGSDGFSGYWYGGVTPVAGPNEIKDQQDRGTWSVTGTFYKANKVEDESSTYDWYEVEITLNWRTTLSGYTDNRGYLVIEPTGGTISNGYIKGYQATPSKTGQTCSSATWSLGVNYGYIGTGIALPIRICDGVTVTRDLNSSTGWRWTTPDVTRTPRWTELVEVKVPEGKSPAFNVKVIYPHYSVYYDHGALRARFTRSYREYSMVLSRTSP